MNQLAFVIAAYAISAAGLGAMIAFLLFERQRRHRELAELEAAGLTRRSARGRSARHEREGAR